MIAAKAHLLNALAEAIEAVVRDAGGGDAALPAAAFESPKQAAHGDLACTVAMALAKRLKLAPRVVAERLVGQLQAATAVRQYVEAFDIAGPGFINVRLNAATRQAVVAEVLSAGDGYGGLPPGDAPPVLVEFVSANPTGPLHVGHGRQAALGDAICRLFETQGQRVDREFYYNDAGVQIATLAASVQSRLHGLRPGDADWPEAAYNGDYIQDIADAFRDGQSVAADDRAFTASGDARDLDNIRAFAVAYLRHEQDLDLAAFGVRFDYHYLESSLYTSGRVEATVQRLIASGHTYEADGALWLRSTDYGDDKDRVMRKSDGSYTYFVPDVAYHIAKWERGYHRAIDIQGTDHHGTISRVRAGLQAAGVGIPSGYPEYTLNKMVSVVRGGAEVKLSKRAGSYVTLRDLIDWTSRDAVRFFLVSRKADSEFVFDVDLATQRNDENPVFYVQYAHARICSVLRQHAQRTGNRATGADVAAAPFDAVMTSPAHAPVSSGGELPSAGLLARLVAPTEVLLMRKLADYPRMLADAAASLSPHDVAFYAREMAAAFHSHYAAERVLQDDAELEAARVALLAATRQVLRNALAVLGVGAPETM